MNKYYKLIHYNSEEAGPLQLKNISGVDAGFSMVATGTPSSTPDLEYSLDGTTWTAYDFTNLPTITVPADGQIYLRGTNTSGFNRNTSNYYSISMDQDYDIIGNVLSIVDKDNFTTVTTVIAYAVASLFRNNTHIIHAHQSNLGKATTTNDRICEYMFSDCTNLLTPLCTTGLISLGSRTFSYTYRNCTSLKYCADFSTVTTLGYYGPFEGTFYGCTSIVDPPCFENIISGGQMAFYQTFYGCTSLKKAPKLGIAEFNDPYQWAVECFRGCTSLVEGMDIRGITFNKRDTAGMNSMYNGCTSLKSAYVAPSYIQEMSNWLQNVPSGGTLYLPYDVVLPISASGVPSNWIVEYY